MFLYRLNEFTKGNKTTGKGDDVVSRHNLDVSESDNETDSVDKM